MSLLIISFDALGDVLFDRIAALPHTAAFLKRAALVRSVRSVFVSNTYPVHTSVLTGLPPGKHGLLSNVPAFPQQFQTWNYRAEGIHAKTLTQAAAEKGLRTASVFWPVSGGSPSIKWNLPEIMPGPKDNLLALYLRNGNPLMLLRLYRTYRHLLDGIKQPARDRFAAAVFCDMLRRHRPDLALIHFTAFDSLCHYYGLGEEGRPHLDEALETLDNGFGALLEAASAPGLEETEVILFSDHAQLPIHTTLLPNDWLVDMQLMSKTCFIECCGGSAFFHGASLTDAARERVKQRIETSEGFNRWLRPDEMNESGYTGCGFCAKAGYQYAAYPSGEKAQHGYPLDYADYTVFYAVSGKGVAKGKTIDGQAIGASLLDIAPIALRLLGRGVTLPGLEAARKDIFI
jgi:hypothetical protein